MEENGDAVRTCRLMAYESEILDIFFVMISQNPLKILYRGKNISILQFLMQVSIICIWISIIFD